MVKLVGRGWREMVTLLSPPKLLPGGTAWPAAGSAQPPNVPVRAWGVATKPVGGRASSPRPPHLRGIPPSARLARGPLAGGEGVHAGPCVAGGPGVAAAWVGVVGACPAALPTSAGGTGSPDIGRGSVGRTWSVHRVGEEGPPLPRLGSRSSSPLLSVSSSALYLAGLGSVIGHPDSGAVW